MAIFSRFFIALCILFIAWAAHARPVPENFVDLAAKLSPAVVNISTAQTVEVETDARRFPEGSPLERFDDFFGNGPIGGRVSKSLGSGFVIDADGYIVTNNHVIEGADVIEVQFPNEDTYTATLIGRDPSTDIALLKIDTGKPMPFVPFGDSDMTEVGEWVIAIGNPFGYGGSVAAGIVSARSRNINHGTYDDFIQTDVAINKGNSGGPLFNMAGEVVGVNTAILSPTGGSVGISFSVPADLTQSVVRQLREFGETRRGTLGLRVQAVDGNLAKSYKLDKPMGALVTKISDDGPSAKSDLKRGDLIVAINGMAVPNSRTLFRQVAELTIGKTAEIEYVRKTRFSAKRRTAEVTVEQLKEKVRKVDGTSEPEIEGEIEATAMGISVEALSKAVRRKYKIKDEVKGVRVVKVSSKSEASGKIIPGDIIEEVAFEAVTSPYAFEKAVTDMQETGSPITILVNQNGNYRFFSLMI